MGAGDYKERHALRLNLKEANLNWAECMGCIGRLSGDFFDSVADALPSEWNGEQDIAAIKQHVLAVVGNAVSFETELQRRIV
jgi:hypothetical protein